MFILSLRACVKSCQIILTHFQLLYIPLLYAHIGYSKNIEFFPVRSSCENWKSGKCVGLVHS